MPACWHSRGSAPRSRGVFLKILAFLNWIALGAGASLTLLYAVVCLMMLPYPEMVTQAGGDFAQVLQTTLVAAGFTVAAALATWLMQRRHAALWYGEAVLVLALAGALVFAITQRMPA